MSPDSPAAHGTELDTLRWQYGLAWRLAEVHIPARHRIEALARDWRELLESLHEVDLERPTAWP